MGKKKDKKRLTETEKRGDRGSVLVFVDTPLTGLASETSSVFKRQNKERKKFSSYPIYLQSQTNKYFTLNKVEWTKEMNERVNYAK